MCSWRALSEGLALSSARPLPTRLARSILVKSETFYDHRPAFAACFEGIERPSQIAAESGDWLGRPALANAVV